MHHTKMLAHDIKDAQSFTDYICSQCNLCFRTPNDPSLFCFPKFTLNRMDFLEEFVISIVQARLTGKAVSTFRTIKKFREIFCHKKTGVCTVNKDKCNKRKRKKCFRTFSDQVLLVDLELPYTGKESKKKKKKNKKKQKAKGKKAHPVEEDHWQDGYGYLGGYGVQATVKDTPEVTIIGKKRFQNKVEKILDEDTD